MSKILLALLCMGFSLSALAEAPSAARPVRTQPLFFPADKNNLQVLPQRFDYALLDEDRLKIGDILIDMTQVTFRIEPTAGKRYPYRVQFSWPAGLINEGELAIKNNSGIAIFNALVSPKNIKVSTSQRSTEDEEALEERAEIATFTADLTSEVVEEMKQFPFMVFCIYREREDTRLYLCSNELYLADKKGATTILPRSAAKKTAMIDINGQVVGNQGLIYLNNSSENVAFRAQTQAGAFLEIETRKQDVDFKDVTVSEDGKKITLIASGTEPVDGKKVRRISETEWQITIPFKRPVLYLKGDGDIPMRQEFNIKGPLPTAKFRPHLSSRTVQKTYASNLRLVGAAPAGVQISAPADEKNSTLQNNQNRFTWNLHNIPAGKTTRRYLSAQAGEQKMTVGYDIFRGLPYAAAIGARYLAPAGVIYADLEFQWWIENFVGLSSDAFRFHWGLALERNQALTENTDYVKVDLTTVELLWRAKQGMNLEDDSWGLTLPLQMVQGPSESAMTYGLGAFWIQKTENRFLSNFMSWSELKFQYFAGSSGDTFKVSSAYNVKAQAYWKMSESFYLRYGLGLSAYKFDPAGAKEDLQLSLLGSGYWKF